jgi:hypothetical protein
MAGQGEKDESSHKPSGHAAGEPQGEHDNKRRVQRMERHVGDVVPGRVQSPEGGIDEIGKGNNGPNKPTPAAIKARGEREPDQIEIVGEEVSVQGLAI